MGGGEERLGCRGSPVDEQACAVGVGEAQTSDVDRLILVFGDHAPEADVESEAAQQPDAGAQLVHLEVALEDLLVVLAGSQTRVVEPVLELAELGGDGGGDGREAALVGGDERRLGLGGESVGQVEDA
jgi:hypothetical protein